MTTVENVLIYEALERNRIYKENKKKELSDSKRKLKIDKMKVKQANTVTKSKIKKTEPKKVVTIKKRKNTGEKEVFEEIRNERPHYCTICNKYITEAQARCFAHLLAKGMYPKYRLNKDNIALVCWPDCHKAIDNMILWHKIRIQQLLELWCSFNSIINTICTNTTQKK